MTDPCRVYGPKMAALGKKGRAYANTAIATSKDLICQNILSKRQLPVGRALSLFLKFVILLRLCASVCLCSITLEMIRV